jgi:hypothetical protein
MQEGLDPGHPTMLNIRTTSDGELEEEITTVFFYKMRLQYSTICGTLFKPFGRGLEPPPGAHSRKQLLR